MLSMTESHKDIPKLFIQFNGMTNIVQMTSQNKCWRCLKCQILNVSIQIETNCFCNSLILLIVLLSIYVKCNFKNSGMQTTEIEGIDFLPSVWIGNFISSIVYRLSFEQKEHFKESSYKHIFVSFTVRSGLHECFDMSRIWY